MEDTKKGNTPSCRGPACSFPFGCHPFPSFPADKSVKLLSVVSLDVHPEWQEEDQATFAGGDPVTAEGAIRLYPTVEVGDFPACRRHTASRHETFL
jgi:hypothetical protein